METRTISYNGEDFVCKYFFDAGTSTNGVDVSVNGKHIGEMWGSELPDEEDKEACDSFQEEVENWLDENYFN